MKELSQNSKLSDSFHSRNMSAPKINFHIKLLSGNNVVLVEAQGYESEIFVPQLVKGRISFQNIIPNRRCCFEAASSGSKYLKNARLMPPASSGVSEAAPANNVNKSWRMSAGREKPEIHCPPVTYRTAAGHGDGSHVHPNIRTMSASNENSDLHAYSSSTTNPTPERARCVPAPYQVVKDTLVQIPSGIKVIRLYRNATAGTPKKCGRIVGAADYSSIGAPSCSTPFNSYVADTTPNLTPLRYPTPHRGRSDNRSGSATKWRRCLTPIRTYSRRPTSTVLQRTPSGLIKKPKIVPTYLSNPTQAPKTAMEIKVRHRKLVIDQKTAISPRSFRKQQKSGFELRRKTADMLPKTRIQYERSKSNNAFDMLTNTSRRMSPQLNQQFRKRCVNKGCSTYLKYKPLCSVPPLEQDKQTRELHKPQKLLKPAELEQPQQQQQQQHRLSLKDVTNVLEELPKSALPNVTVSKKHANNRRS